MSAYVRVMRRVKYPAFDLIQRDVVWHKEHKKNFINLLPGEVIQAGWSIAERTFIAGSIIESAIIANDDPIKAYENATSKGKQCYWLTEHPLEYPIKDNDYNPYHIVISDGDMVCFIGQYFIVNKDDSDALSFSLPANKQTKLNSIIDIRLAIFKAREISAKKASKHYPIIRSKGAFIVASKGGKEIVPFGEMPFTNKSRLAFAIAHASSTGDADHICIKGAHEGFNIISDNSNGVLADTWSFAIWTKEIGYINTNTLFNL
jgi:hypothetical protein